MSKEIKTKKKKIPWSNIFVMLLYLALGAVCGIFMSRHMYFEERSFPQILLIILGFLIALYGAMLLHLIVHEAGHLVFGLVSGYRFSSFRIMSFMIIKDDGKLRFKRLSLAGTAGQCLMSPPDLVKAKIPFVLYNIGGIIMNVLFSAVFFVLAFFTADTEILFEIFLLFALYGIVIAVVNGIPMHLGTVDNDGCNAISLGRNKAALRSFWVQMKVNESISKGKRTCDMPSDWFYLPGDSEMKNSMVAVMGVLYCNRLMDERKFKEADGAITHLLGIESGIVGLHRNLLICDKLYLELIGENRKDVICEMLTDSQKKFMKMMKNFPSVIRTEYAISLLFEKDSERAEKIKESFEKCAKSYPYQIDIQSERELIEIAAKRFSV